MRRNRIFILLGLVLGLATLALFIVLSPRNSNNTESQLVNPASVGVILVGPHDRYGWTELREGNADYAETTLQSSRVIVFDNLNTEHRPDITLSDVVSGMVQRSTRFIFVSSGLSVEGLEKEYPTQIFITNLAMRDDVDSLLPSLSWTEPDTIHIQATAIAQASAYSSTPNTSDDTSRNYTGAVLFCLTLLGLMIIAVSLFGRGLSKHAQLAEPSRSTVIRLINGIQGGKPKKKRSRASLHQQRLAIQDSVESLITDFGDTPPVLHKLSTFVQGDHWYDESFSIEVPSGGEFLGECGAGICKQARYGSDKVAGIEVWVFDKNDIRTTTAILISQTALEAETFKGKLKSKGQLILARPDAEVTLETKTLRLRARILAVQYGYQQNLPSASYFEHLVIELAVWIK